MKIELPDIDIDAASLDELREHADLCAHEENRLRAHAINVQFKLIQRVSELNYNRNPTSVVRKKATTSTRTRSVREILGDSSPEDIFSIDDFK